MPRILEIILLLAVCGADELCAQATNRAGDSVYAGRRLSIDSYLRLSNQRLADFSERDFFLEWSSSRYRSGLYSTFNRNSDFMRSCEYRFSESERTLFLRESLMRYKLLNSQILIEHGTGMKYSPVFIRIR